jgi:hypothetical protein
MNPARLLTRKVIVIRRTATSTPDEMGNPTVAETSRMFRGDIQQANRDENTANTDVQGARWNVFLEAAAADFAEGSAAVSVDGIEYELVGPPWPAYNPRLRRITHVQAEARRTT